MSYVDPGAAFSSNYSNSLMQQQQQQQNQEELKMKMALAAQQIQAGQEALKEKQQESQDRMTDRARAETERDVAAYQPGDFMTDPTLVERARKYHVPLKMMNPPDMQAQAIAQAPAPPASLVANPGEGGPAEQQPPPAAPPEGQPPAALTPEGMGPGVYAGSPQYQTIESEKQRQMAAAAQIEDPAERKAMEFNAQTKSVENPKGMALPAGAFRITPPADQGEAIMRQNPRTGGMDQFVNGQWQPFTGNTAPLKTHWETVPAPKDTTGADLRKDAAVQRARESAYREVENIEKPIRAHTDSLNELGVMLSQNTPVADSVIAPLIIKSTIAGMGSGFRMTQGEIDKVIHSRSAWEDLRAKLLRWNADPTQALSITPAQREQMRQLAISARHLANDQVGKIQSARNDIDEAGEIGDVNKARTRLHNALNQSNESETKPAKGTKSADDYLKEAGIIK